MSLTQITKRSIRYTYASWLHCDASIIQPTGEELVTDTPYILFYRRGDTMIRVEKTVK